MRCMPQDRCRPSAPSAVASDEPQKCRSSSHGSSGSSGGSSSVLPFGLGLGFVERGHNQYLVIGLRRHFTWRLWVDRPSLCFPRRLNRATDAAHPHRRACELARPRRADGLLVPFHQRRTLLGRDRVLRFQPAPDRGRSRSADRRSRGHVHRSGGPRDHGRADHEAARHPGAILELHRGELEAPRRQPLRPLRPAL